MKLLKQPLGPKPDIVNEDTRTVYDIFSDAHPLAALNNRCVTSIPMDELQTLHETCVSEIEKHFSFIVRMVTTENKPLTDADREEFSQSMAICIAMQTVLAKMIEIRFHTMCPDDVDIMDHVKGRTFSFEGITTEEGKPVLH